MKNDINNNMIKSIGLIITAIVLLVIIQRAITEKQEVCIDARITDIIETTEQGKKTYKVYIEYETEEGIQEDMIEEYTPDMKENDIISIDCKMENKYDLIEDGLLGTILFMILFWTLGIAGFGKVIYVIRKQKQEEYLKREGDTILAIITHIDCKNPKFIKKNPKKYFIHCHWIDPSNNQEYTFKSKELLFNPARYLQNANALSVKIKKENPKQYFVDTQVLEQLRKKDLEEWDIIFRKFERKEISLEEYTKKRKEIFSEDF